MHSLTHTHHPQSRIPQHVCAVGGPAGRSPRPPPGRVAALTSDSTHCAVCFAPSRKSCSHSLPGRASQGWCPNVSLLMFWSRNCTPSWEVTAPSLIRIQGPGQSPRPGARRRGTWTLSHALGQVTSLSRKWAPISPRRMRGLDSAKDKIPHSSKHLMCACLLSRFSRVQLFATPWTVACPAPLSMGFSRQEYWSGLPCYPPGELPDPGIKPTSQVS